jgi:hypothetical protein
MSPWVLVLARDLAVTAVEIDDGTLQARLWKGADFHLVLGTRLLRRWPTRPQLGECLSHTQTAPRDASSNSCFRLKKPATPWRQGPEAGWVPSGRAAGVASAPRVWGSRALGCHLLRE